MSRPKLIAVGLGVLALAGIAGAAASDTTVYRLNDNTYRVPHEYEFQRQFRIFWLEGIQGLAPDPDESVWLLLPAAEVAQGVPDFRPVVRGYVEQVSDDVVVNVLGGTDASNFRQDRSRMLGLVAEQERIETTQKIDPTTGWVRVIWLGGEIGTPAEGHSNFYLVPPAGKEHLPPDWHPPSCLGSPDQKGVETFYCNFEIYRNGLIFRFSLRQENLGLAGRIPVYVMSRLHGWES